MTSHENAIAQQLASVCERIAEAAIASGRDPADITLVAVSKTYGADAVSTAIQAGQSVFGENRVQEAALKFPTLRATSPSLRLHLIGPLQTNKVKDTLGLVDMIETLDRPRLADALSAAKERGAAIPELLIQVNVGEEPQKAGIPPDQADAFIRDCRTRFATALRGLMCIPPADADPAPYFATLANLAARHGLPVISMGMSGDYQSAIRHGATQIRVGSAIFGARAPL